MAKLYKKYGDIYTVYMGKIYRGSSSSTRELTTWLSALHISTMMGIEILWHVRCPLLQEQEHFPIPTVM